MMAKQHGRGNAIRTTFHGWEVMASPCRAKSTTMVPTENSADVTGRPSHPGSPCR